MEVFPPDDRQSNDMGNRPTIPQIEQMNSWDDSFANLEKVLHSACEKNTESHKNLNCPIESTASSLVDIESTLNKSDVKRKWDTDIVDSELSQQKLKHVSNMILNTGEVTIQLVNSSHDHCDNIPMSNLLSSVKTDSEAKYDGFSFDIPTEKINNDSKNDLDFIKLDPKCEIKNESKDLISENKPGIFSDIGKSSFDKEENNFSMDIKMVVSREIKSDSGFTDDLSTESKNEFYPHVEDSSTYRMKNENKEFKPSLNSDCPLLATPSNALPDKINTTSSSTHEENEEFFPLNKTENSEQAVEQHKEEIDKKEDNLDKSSKRDDKLLKKKKFERCNIRDIKLEDELDAVTLSAQKEEQERIRRLQEAQMRALQERLQQIEVEKEALSQLFSQSTGDAQGLFGSNSLSDTTVTVDKKVAVKPENDVVFVDSSNAEKEDKLQHALSSTIAAPIEENVIDISSSSSGNESDSEDSDKKDDDIMVLSDEGDEAGETPEDPNNSGAHTNDCFNLPDDEGRVLVNVGHPPEDPDIFLAPQIAKVIKPHQIGGIRFLYDNVVENLERYKSSSGFGCILAHSMGLGKTVQVVSFVDVFLRHTPATLVLCIVPINTIQNWKAEFDMWVPPSNFVDDSLVLSGEVRPRDYNIYTLNENFKTMAARASLIAEWRKNGGVLLMGYEMYRMLALRKMPKIPLKKSKKMKKQELTNEPETNEQIKKYMEEMYEHIVIPGPDLVICDEGHRIKNSLASTSMALKSIKTRRRVVLTGYPLQNNLLEYWCMVDFVRPNYLGSRAEFCNMFERPISNGQCIDSTPRDRQLMRFRSHVLHSLLVGFVQRRGHSVLRAVLPKKEEHVLLIRMTPIQRKLYKCFVKDLLYVQQATNPLKLFAVCCKIWNHPDILYKLLQEKKAQEDIDLDIDITVAGSAGSSTNCGIKKRAYQTKGKINQRSLKALPKNVENEPNFTSMNENIKTENVGCDQTSVHQVNMLSQNEYSQSGSQALQSNYPLKSTLNSKFCQSNYDLTSGMQYSESNQSDVHYGSNGSNNQLPSQQQATSQTSQPASQNIISPSPSIESQYGQQSHNQFPYINTQTYSQVNPQIQSYGMQTNSTQDSSANQHQSSSQMSFQSDSFSSQSNNCPPFSQQRGDNLKQVQKCGQENFSNPPNSNQEGGFSQHPLPTTQKFLSSPQQFTKNSQQACSSQSSQQFPQKHNFSHSSRSQFPELSSTQYSSQTTGDPSQTAFTQATNQSSPGSETSVNQYISQSSFQHSSSQSQFIQNSQQSSPTNQQQYSHQNTYSQMSQQYDQQQSSHSSPTQSQYSQTSANQTSSQQFTQQSPEFSEQPVLSQFQQQNVQSFSDQQAMQTQFHSSQQSFSDDNQTYSQQTPTQEQFSQQSFSQPFIKNSQPYLLQENTSSNFETPLQFSHQVTKISNKQAKQCLPEQHQTNFENIQYSQTIGQKQVCHSSPGDRNEQSQFSSQTYSEQPSDTQFSQMRQSAEFSQLSQSSTQTFTDQITNITSQYAAQQTLPQFTSQTTNSQCSDEANKQGEFYGSSQFIRQENNSSEQYVQSSEQFSQENTQIPQFTQQSEASGTNQQFDSNSQMFSSNTQSNQFSQQNTHQQKTFSQQQIPPNSQTCLQQSKQDVSHFHKQVSEPFSQQSNQLSQQYNQLSNSQQYSQNSSHSPEQFSQQPSQTSQQYNQPSSQNSPMYVQQTSLSSQKQPQSQDYNQQSPHSSQQFNQQSQPSQYSQQSLSSEMFSSTSQPSQFNQLSAKQYTVADSQPLQQTNLNSAQPVQQFNPGSSQSFEKHANQNCHQYNPSNHASLYNQSSDQSTQQISPSTQTYNQSSQSFKHSLQSAQFNQNNHNNQQFNQTIQNQFSPKSIQTSPQQFPQQSYPQQQSQTSQQYSQQPAPSPQHFNQPAQSPQQYSQPVQSPQQFQLQSAQSPQQYNQHPAPSPQQFSQHPVPSPHQYQQTTLSPQQFMQQPSASPQQFSQQPNPSPQQFSQQTNTSSQQFSQQSNPSSQQFSQQPNQSPQQFSQQPNPSPQQFSQQPNPSPQQFSQPAQSPQQFTQSSLSPQQFSQPAPSPQQFSQPAPSPQQFSQPAPSPQQFSQPAPSPQQFSQTAPSPQQFSQTTLSPQQYSQPAPSPQQFSQPAPSPQQFSQPTPSPQHFSQPNQSPQQYTQSAPSPKPFSQPAPSPQSFPQTNPNTQQFSQPPTSQQFNQQISQQNTQLHHVQQSSQHFSQLSSQSSTSQQFSPLSSQTQPKQQSMSSSQYSLQQQCISGVQNQHFSLTQTNQPSKSTLQTDYQNQPNSSLCGLGISQQPNKQNTRVCKAKQSRLKSLSQTSVPQTSVQANLKNPLSYSVQTFQNSNKTNIAQHSAEQSLQSLTEGKNSLYQTFDSSATNKESSFTLHHLPQDSTSSAKCPKAVLQSVKLQTQDPSRHSQVNTDALQNEADFKTNSNANDTTVVPFRDRMDSSINYEWAVPIMKDYVLGVLENSHKMMVLFVIIAETLQMGDKLLVFSQSLSTLDLLEQFLNKIQVPRKPDQSQQILAETWSRNKNYFRLDGSTSAQEREKLINEFNRNDNVSLFLLSTRAGCLGINLVGANRIVVMDASWNPCHDAQAVCRIYRYGQKKQCYIYRLVTDNSLEKRIYDRQVNKQGMSDRVVDELNPESNFTWKDVTTLIQDDEDDGPIQELSKFASSYTDRVLQYLVSEMSPSLSKEPFEHESLLLDRKDLKLTKQEKRLAKQSYEMAKRANMINIRTTYTYLPTGNSGGGQFIINNKQCQWVSGTTIRVLPNQANNGSGNARPGTTATPITASPSLMSSLFKQGVMVQKLTMPSNVSIPVLTPGAPPVVIPAGQDVLVLRTPKGVYLRLPDGRIIAVQLPPSLLAKTQFRPNVVTHFRSSSPKGGNPSTTVINTPRGQSIGIIKQTLQCGGTVRYLGPRNVPSSSGHNSSRGSAPEVIDLSDDEEPSMGKHGLTSNASTNSSESESGSGDIEKPEKMPSIFPGKHITIRKISPNVSISPTSKDKCEIPQVLSKNKQITILPINPSTQQTRQKFPPQLAQSVRVQQMLLQPQQGKRKTFQKNASKSPLSSMFPVKSVKPQITVTQPVSTHSNFPSQKIRQISSLQMPKHLDFSEKSNEQCVSIKVNTDSQPLKINEKNVKSSSVSPPQNLPNNKNSSVTVCDSGKNQGNLLPPSLAALAVNPNLQITPTSHSESSLSDILSQKSCFSKKSISENASLTSYFQTENSQNSHSAKSNLQTTPTSSSEISTSDSLLYKTSENLKSSLQNTSISSSVQAEHSNTVTSSKPVLQITSSSESTTISDAVSQKSICQTKSFVQRSSEHETERSNNVVHSLSPSLQITPIPQNESSSISDLFSQTKSSVQNSQVDIKVANSSMKPPNLSNKGENSSPQVSTPQSNSNMSSLSQLTNFSNTLSSSSSSSLQIQASQHQISVQPSIQQVFSSHTNNEAKQKQQTVSLTSSQSMPNTQVSFPSTVSKSEQHVTTNNQHVTSRKRKSSNKQPSKKSQQQLLLMSQNHVLQPQPVESTHSFLHPQLPDHLLPEKHFPTFSHHISGTDFTAFPNFSPHKANAHIQHPQPLHPLQHSQEHSLLPHLQHMSHLYSMPPHLTGPSSLPDTQSAASRAWSVPQPSVSSFHPFSQSSPYFSSGQESSQFSFPSSFPLPPSTLTPSVTQSDSNTNVASGSEKSSRITTSNL